jgi:DNA (cytosine-5)-methyltransferase 1
MLPGIPVTPPVALAAALMSAARTDTEPINAALSRLRGLANIDKATLDSAAAPVAGTKAAQALERLRPLVRRKSAWLQPDRLPDLVGLKPAERQIFLMLQGHDVLLRSQSVLRVAARVAGSKSDETNRLTDGRIDLSRLVGSGSDAALRMAALRVIGTTVCKAEQRACGTCPLAAWCNTAQRAAALPT